MSVLGELPSASRRPEPNVSVLACRVYEVPTEQPEADGTLAWSATTVVTVELCSAEHRGLGWTYASSACKNIVEEQLRPVVLGRDCLDTAGLHEEMVRRCRNLGRPGIVASAISAVDIALWDLKARLLELPLCQLFGRCRSSVPLYGSGGFTTYDEETAKRQLVHWTDDLGMTRVKIKIGESWGENEPRDLTRVAQARGLIGDHADLYVDANGGYTRKQAVRMGLRICADYGVSWFEEPVSSDDLAGLREVRDQLPCDVAAGEYGYDESYFARMVAAGAVDCLQIDVTRCGGYTTFLRAAAIAGANGLQVSAHCAPNLHSPVAAAIPNLRHVEYFRDHERADAMLFEGLVEPVGGEMKVVPERHGHGMALKAAEGLRVG